MVLHCRPFWPTSSILRVLFSITAIGLFLNLFLLLRTTEHCDSTNTDTTPSACINNQDSNQDKKHWPVVWIYAKKELAMSHVMAVFDRLQYRFSLPGEAWDVMWSHSYPYNTFKEDLKNLLPHQKINHFPGTSCIVSKPKLSTQGFSFTPRTFRLPYDAEHLLAVVKENPEKLWVQKSNNHRGIRVIKPKEIELHIEGSIVQEFITKPMLVDGRAFDIGVYTMITSINPLRVYVYGEEILWRFCAKDYYPFNPKNKQSYVVDDDYTPAWEIPSVAPLVKDKALSHKEAFNQILKIKGFKPEQFWNKAHSIIQKVLYHCESNVVNYTKSYASTRNFFELVRFDLIIDEELNVWLLEVNLSPNLSSAHTTDNRFMYEQVIFNSLKLAGLARGMALGFAYNGQQESIMLVNDHDIQVPIPQCLNGTCNNCQSQIICQLCYQCRSEDFTFVLKTAFLEHAYKTNYYRLVPPPQTGCHGDYLLTGGMESHISVRINNYLMNEWFKEKCCQQAQWCS